MNILHISTAKSWRGGEQQVYHLMAGLARAGDQGILMCPSNAVIKERASAHIHNHVAYASGWNHLLGNITRLSRACREFQIDIIHCHDSHAHTLVYAASKVRRIMPKVVVSRRLANPISSNSLKKYNARVVSQYVCVSDHVKSVMEKSVTNHTKLQTIHSGVEIPDSELQRIVRSEGTLTIGYVAALTPEKNHEVMLEVANLVLDQGYDVRFVIVGEGQERTNLEGVVSKWPSEKSQRLDFKGFVVNVAAEYQKMDILFHPSKEEALGTSILEAQSFGMPVVASKVGGIPEIVKDGFNGFLCDYADIKAFSRKVIQLIKDAELRQAFADRSLESVQEFSKDRMVSHTRQLYSKLVDL